MNHTAYFQSELLGMKENDQASKGGGGGDRVFRQTEIARKMVGKTEIIPKPAATEIEAMPVENSIVIYCFFQVLHFLTNSIRYFAIFWSKYALFNIDKWISCVSIESNSKQTRVCKKNTFCCFKLGNSGIGWWNLHTSLASFTYLKLEAACFYYSLFLPRALSKQTRHEQNIVGGLTRSNYDTLLSLHFESP